MNKGAKVSKGDGIKVFQASSEVKILRLMNYKGKEKDVLTATKCTVQPVTRTPACNTNLWAFAPLKEGSRDGWMFSIFPGKL